MADPIQQIIEALQSVWREGLTGNNVYQIESALTLALSLQQGEGWMPIETAPKDGNEVLLAEGDYVCTGFWHDGSECHGHRGGAGWFSEDDRHNLLIASNIHPTHWRRFPPPPTKEGERA